MVLRAAARAGIHGSGGFFDANFRPALFSWLAAEICSTDTARADSRAGNFQEFAPS
jgi:hypothetical protein